MPAVAPLSPSHAAHAAAETPRVSRLVLEWFARHASRRLRRQFHAVHLTGPLPDFEAARPMAIYLNHASWWDPLVCLSAARKLAWRRRNYAPIDARSLERFGFFKKLGFYGVEKGSARCAAAFLRTSARLLEDPATVLWITPQGRFVDQRQRPVLLKRGIAHLRQKAPEASFVPLAIDYFFGAERLPGVALRFGEPVKGSSLNEMEEALEGTMDQLASEVLAGSFDQPRVLVRGAHGAGGIYGLWQRLRRSSP